MDPRWIMEAGMDYHKKTILEDDGMTQISMSFYVTPFDVPVTQTWLQVVRHFEIIKDFDIKLFIEIGVYLGGLASVIIPRTEYTDFYYLGVEINPGPVDARVKAQVSRLSGANKAHIIYGDAFNPGVIQQVKAKINAIDSPCYLFCDGGNKPREMMTYAPLLRSGDLLAIHDWSPSGTGEVSDKDLEKLAPNFEEIKPDYYRHMSQLPLFRKK
jgi:cephalosporin hydroxylase